MCQILEEFWYGNICPDTDCCKGTKAEKELQEYIVTHYEDLHATLTEEQKEMLEKYDADREIITRDIHSIVEKLRSVGALQEP